MGKMSKKEFMKFKEWAESQKPVEPDELDKFLIERAKKGSRETVKFYPGMFYKGKL